MNSTSTPALRQSKTAPIIFGLGFVVAMLAALFLYVRSDSLKNQLEATRTQLKTAQDEIALLRPLAIEARQMPVAVTFRKALTGDGYVLSFQNKISKSLSLNIDLRNPTSRKSKTYELVVDGGATKEIGHLEGWTSASGDSIKVVCAGFDPITTKVP